MQGRNDDNLKKLQRLNKVTHVAVKKKPTQLDTGEQTNPDRDRLL